VIITIVTSQASIITISSGNQVIKFLSIIIIIITPSGNQVINIAAQDKCEHEG